MGWQASLCSNITGKNTIEFITKTLLYKTTQEDNTAERYIYSKTFNKK